MSAPNDDVPDLDFWEFVSCCRCFRSFEGDPSTPFWLTECGHVVCNAHLNPDQSCAQCGAVGIQLVPLQSQMDAPMSDWFRSIPHALDTVAYAVKFQQETMAYQIRFYKSRQQQQRTLIERLKRDVADLRRTNEALSNENAQFRQHLGYEPADNGPVPSEYPNHNGKRQMLNSDPYRPATSSSHSNVLPQGPDRLTLPPGQHPPTLSSNRVDNRAPGRAAPNNQRPGSSRFADKYAYAPPLAQLPPQQMSYSQSAPRRAKQNADPMPLPASQSTSRFKPAQHVPPSDTPARAQPLAQLNNQSLDAKARKMGPPPTPQLLRAAGGDMSHHRNPNNRSLPPAQRFAPPAPVDQRFIPSTSNGAPQRFGNGTSTSQGVGGRSSQRTPFVPGGFG
ncbi:RING-type domain-containing protein [Mycena kentingensis (nom. inval.)]|nr:RING-type domain-containing protein [Mycena kentingensis (nom. inval.)]